jgi:hypothetical protein
MVGLALTLDDMNGHGAVVNNRLSSFSFSISPLRAFDKPYYQLHGPALAILAKLPCRLVAVAGPGAFLRTMRRQLGSRYAIRSDHRTRLCAR